MVTLDDDDMVLDADGAGGRRGEPLLKPEIGTMQCKRAKGMRGKSAMCKCACDE